MVDQVQLKVKFVGHGAHWTNPPGYHSEEASGLDVRAAIAAPIRIGPGQHEHIPLGIAVEVPRGYEIQLRSRSGMAHNHGVALLNGVGTIDSDFRGELVAILRNHSGLPFVVTPNQRIAQIVVVPVVHAEVVVVDELSPSERGEDGYGSTGDI